MARAWSIVLALDTSDPTGCVSASDVCRSLSLANLAAVRSSCAKKMRRNNFV